MDLLVLLIVLVVLFAIFGGIWINPFVFFVLLVAIVLILVAGRSRL